MIVQLWKGEWECVCKNINILDIQEKSLRKILVLNRKEAFTIMVVCKNFHEYSDHNPEKIIFERPPVGAVHCRNNA